jgi:uncharacterized membrane protein
MMLNAIEVTVVVWALGVASGIALAAIVGHLSDARCVTEGNNQNGGQR